MPATLNIIGMGKRMRFGADQLLAGTSQQIAEGRIYLEPPPVLILHGHANRAVPENLRQTLDG